MSPERTLTTEVLSPDMTGSWTSRQEFSFFSQASIKVMTSSGSVAVFTSDRPLAQAAELTSHMKANTAVTPRSWNIATVRTTCPTRHLAVARRTYDQRAFVVLLVLVVEEDVDAESRGGVEEGEDADGDEELGGGRVVSDQEDPVRGPVLTGGGVEVHLVESDRRRVCQRRLVLPGPFGSAVVKGKKCPDLNGYSNSTCMARSLSVRFLHSTAILNIPE